MSNARVLVVVFGSACLAASSGAQTTLPGRTEREPMQDNMGNVESLPMIENKAPSFSISEILENTPIQFPPEPANTPKPEAKTYERSGGSSVFGIVVPTPGSGALLAVAALAGVSGRRHRAPSASA